MSNDRFYDDIKRLLEANGAMGVNQLSKELNVQLSTMQQYLDKRQTYFKKNHARKWILPENAAIADNADVTNNFADIIDSQLQSMNVLMKTIMSQFQATITLIEANKPRLSSVAALAPDIDPQMLKSDKKVKDTQAVFKKYVGKCPEEYRDLLKNVDLYRLSIEMGSKYLGEGFNTEITSLFLQQSDELSEEVLNILKTYQKGE